jgi:hypothetical protein
MAADLIDSAGLLFAAEADLVDHDLDANGVLGDGLDGSGNLIDLALAFAGLGEGLWRTLVADGFGRIYI